MTSVAIVGVLVTIALPSYRTFQYKAIQAESLVNLRSITQTITAKEIDTKRFFDSADTNLFPNQDLDTGTWGYLTYQYDENCDLPDPFGFSVQDCKQSRYFYLYQSQGGASGEWIVLAKSDNQKIVGCNVEELIYVNQCGNICKLRQVDPATCTEIIGDCVPTAC